MLEKIQNIRPTMKDFLIVNVLNDSPLHTDTANASIAKAILNIIISVISILTSSSFLISFSFKYIILCIFYAIFIITAKFKFSFAS